MLEIGTHTIQEKFHQEICLLEMYDCSEALCNVWSNAPINTSRNFAPMAVQHA